MQLVAFVSLMRSSMCLETETKFTTHHRQPKDSNNAWRSCVSLPIAQTIKTLFTRSLARSSFIFGLATIILLLTATAEPPELSFTGQCFATDTGALSTHQSAKYFCNPPAKYTRAYLHTKTDSNDLTHFILHQLEVIHRADQELHEFVKKKSLETEKLQIQLRDMHFLNHRQRNLVGSALKTPHKIYTIQAHKQSEIISYQTARTDLLDLEKRGLFVKRKSGKRLEFSSVPDLEKTLRLSSSERESHDWSDLKGSFFATVNHISTNSLHLMSF